MRRKDLVDAARLILLIASLVGLLLMALGLIGPQRAQAATFQPAAPAWEAWQAASRVAAPDVVLHPSPDECAGPVAGCTVGAPYWDLYATSRTTFYFELGHAFDYSMLTDSDRAYLARRLGSPHWHWANTYPGPIARALSRGDAIEDGLEGVFASVYQECAWGRDPSDTSLGVSLPVGVPARLVPGAYVPAGFDVCAYIDRVAARDEARPPAGMPAAPRG